MTFLIVSLFTVAFIFLLFNWIKTSKLLLLVTGLFFIAVGSGLVSRFILTKLEIYPPLTAPHWQQHNAIVLLGAGTVRLQNESIKPLILAYSRIYEAARLYSLCKQTQTDCRIIVSGGDALGTGKSEARVYQEELAGIGVKPADVLIEEKSMDTYKNAQFTSAMLKTEKLDNVVLVTSGIHMQRSLLYFSHFGIQATPAVADYISPKISIFLMGYNFAMTDFAVHEWMGVLRFHLYNYLGWNATVSAAGAL